MNLLKKLGLATVSFMCAFAFAENAPEGSFENAAPADLQKIIAADKKLKPAKDEFVVYYYRKDGDYEPWGLWTWAIPGGDGAAMWEYTQKWSVIDGVGYMRLPMDGSKTGGNKPVSADGTVGLIVRMDEGWTKDCNDDRIWNISNSNKAAIISKDQNTYAAEDYKPSVKAAELTALDTIQLTLSGKFGLYASGDSGFKVLDKNGKAYAVSKVFNSDSAKAEDNYTKNVTVKLASKCDISDSLKVVNAAFAGECAVNNQKLAVKLADANLPGTDVQLGAVYAKGKVDFNLWAPTSSSASANIYKNASSSKADYTVTLTKNAKTGVWSGEFSSVDPDGMFYDFTLTNSKGKVTVLDPYAKSMAAYNGKGGAGRGAIVDLNSAKALPAGGMSEDYVKVAQREDVILYEISVRDFTISDDAGVKAMPGTYKAFIEKIPYLKELGITHVQLMPVLNFYNNDENNKAYDNRGVVNNSNYNWGYDPHNYFTPEGWYATDANNPYSRVRELRELVNELHKAGIGVVLDVVYNHMADASFLDNIVPGYYFRTNGDGKLKSNSGCGNDTATERAMMKRIVVNSTKYWVENYKIDGFRFDLMGLMEASSVVDAYNECAKINPSVLFEGEGWKMYNGDGGTVGMDQNYMTKTNSVAVFNDEFRDLVKAGGFNETGLGFITGKAINTQRLFRNMTGTPTANYKADDPGDNLMYLVCHDGLTLHDLIVNNVHLDEKKDRAEIVQRIKLGNFIGMTSQGIAFLHGGQERGRTKPNVNMSKNECINNFVRNSYDASDDINQIVWSLDSDYESVLNYTKGLIELRKNTSVFRMGDASKLAKNAKFLGSEEDSNVLAYSIKDNDGTYIVIVNAGKKSASVKTGLTIKTCDVLVDAKTAGSTPIENPEGVSVKGKAISVAPLTATVIRVK